MATVENEELKISFLKSKKLPMILAAVFFLLLPVLFLASTQKIKIFKKAYFPISPPISPPDICQREWHSIPVTPEGFKMVCCAGLTLCPPPERVVGIRGTCKKNCDWNSVRWETPYVLLEADDFYIDIGGIKHYPKQATATVHSDPPDPSNPKYTTLEVAWFEGNIEMRFYLYFTANDREWWISEIRTYNGKTPGDWIYYKIHESISKKIPFSSFLLMAGYFAGNPQIKASINFQNLHLGAFRNYCSLKSYGDANCDNKINLSDFFIWRREFLGPVPLCVGETTNGVQPLCGPVNWQADFNNDRKVNLQDFFIWRKGFLNQL